MQTENGGEGAPQADGQPAPEENLLTSGDDETADQQGGDDASDDGSDAPAPLAAETPAPSPQSKPKRAGWEQKRIDELTREKHDARRESERLQRELEAARALVGVRKPDGEGAAPVASQPPAADFQTAVEREATRVASERVFNERCNSVFSSGVKDHGADFEEGVADLNRAGVLNRAFVEAALETEAPAMLLHHLGQDPTEAQRIAKLSPTKMAIELDRLAQRIAKPASAPVSRAPAPITPVTGSVKAEFDFADPNADEKEWAKRFLERRSKSR